MKKKKDRMYEPPKAVSLSGKGVLGEDQGLDQDPGGFYDNCLTGPTFAPPGGGSCRFGVGVDTPYTCISGGGVQ